MSRRHGRATIPSGQFKGRPVGAMTDQYLMWMASESIYAAEKQFGYLMESVHAELRHRGFQPENIEICVPPVLHLRCLECGELFEARYQRPLCDGCREYQRRGMRRMGADLQFPVKARRQIEVE